MNNHVYRFARPKKTKNGIPIPLAYEIGQAMRTHWNNYTINPQDIIYLGTIDNVQVFSYLFVHCCKKTQYQKVLICEKMPDGKKKYRDVDL